MKGVKIMFGLLGLVTGTYLGVIGGIVGTAAVVKGGKKADKIVKIILGKDEE